ncbi:MAG: hypothetical protein ACLQVL_03615 [Terriglobia bacterium]
MKNAVKMNVLLALAIMGMGMLVAGCKPAPPLTQDQALAMIQAKYDATPAVGANIVVNNDAMVLGATAKLWNRTTIYPNKYWADFTLTPEGKKAVKLTGGGDVIKWRPDSPTDKKYSIVMVTTAANHLKARDIQDIQDVGKTKTVTFTEGVDLTGVPDVLVNIAHNPGNQLSTTRLAVFVLDGGAWKLQSVD